MKKREVKKGTDFGMQPILFTREQYKELLRAFGAYTLIKQASIVPDPETGRLYNYIIDQGKKFGYEKNGINNIICSNIPKKLLKIKEDKKRKK